MNHMIELSRARLSACLWVVSQLTWAGGSPAFSFLQVITRCTAFSFSPVMAAAEIYMEGSSTGLGKTVPENCVEANISSASPSPLIPQCPHLYTVSLATILVSHV